MVKRIFFRKELSVGSAVGILMISLFFSNILGLVKLRLLSQFFGASEELGVFLAADRLPSFIFNLLIIGSFSSSFIPVFSSYFAKEGREKAFHFASSLANIVLLVFGILSLIIFIFAPQFSYLLSFGSLSREGVHLMSDLTRILIISQFFLMISIFITGILQSLDRFLVPAISPIAWNIGSIFSIVLLSPYIGIYSAAWGAVVGSLLHLVIQLPMLRAIGYRHSWNFRHIDNSVREVGKLIVPRTLGLAVDQINLLFDTALSLSLSASSVVILNFAQRLQFLPVVLFGSTVSQAVLPSLSRLASRDNEKDVEEFKKLFVSSLHQMLYLILPVSIILLILRLPLVRLTYGTHRFDWLATNLTGYTLAFFSLGVFSQSVASLLARAFYAFKDTRTPLKVGFFSVMANIILSLFFVKILHFNVWSLALSSSISTFINSLILFQLLEKKIGIFDRQKLLAPIIKMAYSGLVMGLFIYLPLKFLDQGGWGTNFPLSFGRLLLDTRYTVNLLFLTITSTTIGLVFYIFLTLTLRVSEGQRVMRLFLKFKGFGKYFSPPVFQE